MKAYMQALHHKLHVVLVQIMPYNCSETYYSFCEDWPTAGLCRLPGCGYHRQTPSASPTIFFSLRRPCQAVVNKPNT